MKLMAFICLLLVTTSACGSGTHPSATEHPPATEPTATAVPSSTETEATTPLAPTMQGNAATNAACKLLTLEQVSTLTGLKVTGMRGVPTVGTPPSATIEDCGWFLDSTEIQASLVVQYSLYPKPPADLKALYPQVIKQGLATRVPKLGDLSKIHGHSLTTIYKRSEIRINLILHAEATPQDQAAEIAMMRLIMPLVRQ